jgi:hydroxyacylglutathione hydrolase
MQLLPDIYLVGSGHNGIGISDPFDCHVYLLDGGTEAALIDAGAGVNVEPLLANIQQHIPLHKLRYVILTHGHADHSASAAALRERFDCRVLLGDPDADSVETGDAEASGLSVAAPPGGFAQSFHLIACPVDRRLHDGDRITVGCYALQAIATPGHSPGSTCFLVEASGRRVLFSGDCIQFAPVQGFVGWIALLNSASTNINAYRASARRLGGMAVDALLPGHRLFTLSDGQRIIDDVIQGFSSLSLPRSAI